MGDVPLSAVARRGVQIVGCLLWRLLPLRPGRRDARPGLNDPHATLIFLSAEGKVVATSVGVAANFESRRIGLLNRDSLRPDEGLLLSPGGSIHTVGMRFAIDVLFLDTRMQVLKRVFRLPPWRVAFAPSGTQYVLELAPGRIVATDIEDGTHLLWLECRPGESSE